MKRIVFCVMAVALALMLVACECVTFNPLAASTQYGPPTYSSGSLVFTENNIPVRVFDFGSGGSFNFCKVLPASAYPGFGLGNIMNTNNITLELDFSGLSFQPRKVIFGYMDLGGTEHLRVNNEATTEFVGELQSMILPYNIASGVQVTSITKIPTQGGFKGRVTVVGSVNLLRVGGQEFFLDNLCAYQYQ